MEMTATERRGIEAERMRLRGAIRLAVSAFELLTDPDPEKGILTNVKQQGAEQGIPLDATYDAILNIIVLLKADLGESDEAHAERFRAELQFGDKARELAQKIRDRDRSDPYVEWVDLVDELVALVLDGNQPQEESQ